MERGLIELRGCMASLERMIERARLLTEEFDRRCRKTNFAISPESLQCAIAFPEVRSLELLCKDTIERVLPDHPEIVANWYVHKDVGGDSPEDLHSSLIRKRAILNHAIDLAEATSAVPMASKQEVGNAVPRGYDKLSESVRQMFADKQKRCQDYDRNVFIMTRFQPSNRTLEQLDDILRSSLLARGLVGHRADDRCYPNDRNLWDNVCTYMLGCKYGVAVLEDILAEDFNPNVALEYGFMRALGKPTLLLKERRFKPRADILGTLWHEFDVLDIQHTVPSAIDKWLDDIGIPDSHPASAQQ